MKLSKLMLCAFSAVAIVGSAFAEVKVSDITAKGKEATLDAGVIRSGVFTVKDFPKELKGLKCISVPRGSHSQAGSTFSFKISAPATVYLFVDVRGEKKTKLEGWEKTTLKAIWVANKKDYPDIIYKKDFEAGTVEIPANTAAMIPCLAVIKSK